MRSLLIALILSIGATTASADFKQSGLPSRSFASAGDVAVGAIVSETADRLELNVTPCASAPTVIVYRKPFVKDAVPSLHCGATATAQMQVIQK
jgi:hypothetical protein